MTADDHHEPPVVSDGDAKAIRREKWIAAVVIAVLSFLVVLFVILGSVMVKTPKETYIEARVQCIEGELKHGPNWFVLDIPLMDLVPFEDKTIEEIVTPGSPARMIGRACRLGESVNWLEGTDTHLMSLAQRVEEIEDPVATKGVKALFRYMWISKNLSSEADEVLVRDYCACQIALIDALEAWEK